MHPHDVEAVGPEALEAVLDGVQGGFGGVVVDHLVRTAVLEESALLAEVPGSRVLDLAEDDAAHLRTEDELVARVL
ncbi:hypothetical protein GCM10010207_64130 [Streptomyces atratus]|nr:hypothetical protein GCM10010207_64130 [Streptomyces atratus]